QLLNGSCTICNPFVIYSSFQNEGETETVQTRSVRRRRSSKFSEIESSSGEECETTEQPSCSHRGGPRNVHEETFKIQIDDEWEILLECHNRRPGRPRKVIEETPNDVTNDVEEEQSEPDSDMMVVEEETGKEHETRSRSQHCRRGRSRKFLEGTSSRKEDQETLLQSQHCHVGLSRKVLEGLFNEMTLENNTSVPVSPRKCVAKKSTGTRAIQSKSQQQVTKIKPFFPLNI
ncbi:uncharacterized protein LOC118201136, partial [Stegodyphus dumicola]|uniref:uncharacterized protein LOC118201136 n=1 Tax=Stegodyphus dumicola TaxID=202533 RepID=UPI0015AC4CAD